MRPLLGNAHSLSSPRPIPYSFTYGIVRYERRKQDRTFPVLRESRVLISQGNASRHERRPCGCTVAPCSPWDWSHAVRRFLPNRPLCTGLGSSAESDIGDLSHSMRDSLRLEKAWVLGVYPTCGTCLTLTAAQSRDNALRLPQQPGSLSGDTIRARRRSLYARSRASPPLLSHVS